VLTTPTAHFLKTWAWTWVPALALLGVLAYKSFEPFPRSIDASDPSNLRSGSLNSKAVATVKEFRDFPILWMDESYQGFNLTTAQHDRFPSGPTGREANRVILVYGECRSRDNCVPPIAVIISAPGSVPVPVGFEPPGMNDPTAVRGLFSGFGEHPTVWTTAGLTIEVQANAMLEDNVLEALSLANATAFGLPEIGPGESLAPLHAWSP
jgi:hypothetical protein